MRDLTEKALRCRLAVAVKGTGVRAMEDLKSKSEYSGKMRCVSELYVTKSYKLLMNWNLVFVFFFF